MEDTPAQEAYTTEQLLSSPRLMFEAASLTQLTRALDEKTSLGESDPELCTAILRLYQLYPQCADDVVIRKVFINALLKPHDNEYACYCCMLPNQGSAKKGTREAKRLAQVIQLHEFIDQCKFKQVWELLRDQNMSDVLQVPGILDAIRRYCCDALQVCASTITLNELMSLLNLGSASHMGFEDKLDRILKPRGWTVDSGTVLQSQRIVTILPQPTAAAREVDAAAKAPAGAAAGAPVKKNAEKYFTPEGFQQCIAPLLK